MCSPPAIPRAYFLLPLFCGIASTIFADGLHAQNLACPEVADSVRTMSLADDPAICLDCITLSREVVLGEEDGEGFIERAGSKMAVDGPGRFWVMRREGATVFAQDGRFLRVVGRRGGDRASSFPPHT